MVRSLRTPLGTDQIADLRVGERVHLSGVIYGARDAAHARLLETLEAGGVSPIPLDGQVIYYVGPAPARPGSVIGPAGPTTSVRMDPYTPALLARGVRATIGKGRRSPDVRTAMARHGAVYLTAVGGAAALLSERIVRHEVLAYADLGPEAIRLLEVKDFPLVVANDVHGGDLFELGRQANRGEEPSA